MGKCDHGYECWETIGIFKFIDNALRPDFLLKTYQFMDYIDPKDKSLVSIKLCKVCNNLIISPIRKIEKKDKI